MVRFNAKGYKPWIRPYMPHCWNLKHGKAMVIKKVSPTARQLALLRLGTFSVVNDSAKLEKLVDALPLDETTIQEPICADMSCGEVGDYSLTYADPSRPPPKHGWLQKAMQYAAAFFLFLMVLVGFTACKKEPIPDVATPKQTPSMAPTDTIPHVPMDPGPAEPMKPALTGFELFDLTINWGHAYLIEHDSVQYVANCNRCKDVIIKSPQNLVSLGFLPGSFHMARDTLTVIMNELRNHDKGVRGYGKIYTIRHDLPNDYELYPGFNPCGMSGEDYDWFTLEGWTVVDTTINKAQKHDWFTLQGWTVVDTTMNKAQKHDTNNRQTLPNQQTNKKFQTTGVPVRQFLNATYE